MSSTTGARILLISPSPSFDTPNDADPVPYAVDPLLQYSLLRVIELLHKWVYRMIDTRTSFPFCEFLEQHHKELVTLGEARSATMEHFRHWSKSGGDDYIRKAKLEQRLQDKDIEKSRDDGLRPREVDIPQLVDETGPNKGRETLTSEPSPAADNGNNGAKSSDRSKKSGTAVSNGTASPDESKVCSVSPQGPAVLKSLLEFADFVAANKSKPGAFAKLSEKAERRLDAIYETHRHLGLNERTEVAAEVFDRVSIALGGEDCTDEEELASLLDGFSYRLQAKVKEGSKPKQRRHVSFKERAQSAAANSRVLLG